MLTLKISSRQTSRSVTTFGSESFQEPFYSSPAKLLKRTTSMRRKMRTKTAKRKVRRRKTTQTSIPPRSRTHRSASSSRHHVRYPLSLDLTSTDQNNLSWNSRCVYCNFSHFYPTATLNLLTILLDKYAKSVYVPSKDVYFVALYYYYGKFTELTPFEKNMPLNSVFWRALYQNVLLPVTLSPYRTQSNDKSQLNT